jgi:molybdate transport system substrate-binding protein
LSLARLKTAAAALALAACAVAAMPAAAADLRVLCPAALRVPMLELARSFVKGGHKVEFVFASVGAIHKRVATGERGDVAIGTAQGIDALARLGRGIEGSQALLVHPLLALVVRKGAATTHLGTAESLAQLLRDATAIVVPDPARGVPGGSQVAELFERLGVADEVRSKTQFVSDAREVAKRAAAEAGAIGVAAMSDLVAAADVTVVVSIAEPATTGVTYAAMVIRGSAVEDAGRAFIAHLLSADAATVFRKAGYAPIH